MGIFLLVASNSSIAQAQQDPVMHLRPAGSPDVVIIDFSGRCGFLGVPLNCTPPVDNPTYLANAKNHTVKEVEDAFTTLGYTVQSFDASAFIDAHYSHMSHSVVPGYAEAEAYLEFVWRHWVQGYDNPTRIVILAHSHGVVWASLLIWNHPDIRFAYAIYLDGVCALWRADNMESHAYLQVYFNGQNRPLPWPLDTNNEDAPCDVQFPNPIGRRNLSDVVPWNVAYNIEVFSDGEIVPGVSADIHPNVRLDGSSSGIFSHVSPSQSHSQVGKAGKPAMDWVFTQILELGLPPLQPQVLAPPKGFSQNALAAAMP